MYHTTPATAKKKWQARDRVNLSPASHRKSFNFYKYLRVKSYLSRPSKSDTITCHCIMRAKCHVSATFPLPWLGYFFFHNDVLIALITRLRITENHCMEKLLTEKNYHPKTIPLVLKIYH